MRFDNSFALSFWKNNLWISEMDLCQAASLWLLCSRRGAGEQLGWVCIKNIDFYENPDFMKIIQKLDFVHFWDVFLNPGAFAKPASWAGFAKSEFVMQAKCSFGILSFMFFATVACFPTDVRSVDLPCGFAVTVFVVVA